MKTKLNTILHCLCRQSVSGRLLLQLVLMFMLSVPVQAQFIPIDSGFAEILRLRNPSVASCINNYQLDTTCAKAANPVQLKLVPHSSSALSFRAKSFEGLQYFAKSRLGLKATQSLWIDSNAYLAYLPLLPAVYNRVEIYRADSLIHLPYMGDSVKDLVCDRAGVKTMDALPVALQNLRICYTSITTVPALPASMISLMCYFNRITVLPALNQGLEQLDCNRNPVTTIPALPSSLRSLNAHYCPINVLPVLPNGLQLLHCDSCNLTALPATLPDSLYYMHVSYNNIAFIPPVNAVFQFLYIDQNRLTSLPVLSHTRLMHLYCRQNAITSLPLLPATVDVLDCSDNLIDGMVNFPAGVTSFIAGNNRLSQLPPFNQALVTLRLYTNNVSKLPQLPPNLRYLDFNNNPVTCLPPLPPALQTLNCINTNVTCIPNKPLTLSTLLQVCTDVCGYNGFGGRLFADYNGNCIFDSTDIPLRNRVLKIGSMEEYTTTDNNGVYRFVIPDSGSYSYRVLNITYPYAFSCGDSIMQLHYNGIDTVDTMDIALAVIGHCANPIVDISIDAIVNSRNNTHHVFVVNTGTDTAHNAYMLVKFDPELIPLSSTLAWSQVLPGNTLRFDLGDIVPNQEIKFAITDSASIAAPLGQTACVKANIFPQGNCAPPQPAWDSSDVVIQSRWNAGDQNVIFKALNAGSTMADSSEYRIYEEELLMFRDKFLLKSLDSLIITLPANGHTYRVEADQRPLHPGFSKPRDFMELAGAPPFNLGFIVPVPQDDDDEWVEIDCHEIRGSYDPNAKDVFPAGVGVNHYITKDDQLDYIIHFQNTGNDTALIVRLIDTLDIQHLDISSFTSGASSHSYSVSISGSGIVQWRFANIMLPDSNTNEPASHGFVKFKIRQLAGNAPGTLINNFADIYFDYNAPVRTNTAFVTIEEKENIFPMKITGITEVDNNYSIRVMPNPFMESATFAITTTAGADSYTFELADVMGRTVLSKKVSDSFMLRRSDISPGMYFFRITQNNHLVGTGKIIAK